MKYVNVGNFEKAFASFKEQTPFPYAVIDNFFSDEVAHTLAQEFPDSSADTFNGNYFNQIEIKRTCNMWDRFLPTTYNVFNELCSPEFLSLVSVATGTEHLYADFGLHGGGQHTHPPGGKLNVHLDYNIHPKMQLQRKYNLLVYLNPNWQPGWGGELGLWSHDDNTQGPKELVRLLEPVFNRAVLFDTTLNSWHGLEVPNQFPEGQDRKSLALYYLVDPPEVTDSRNRALFAPSKEQENDPEVLDLIKRRSQAYGGDPTKWSRT